MDALEVGELGEDREVAGTDGDVAGTGGLLFGKEENGNGDEGG